MNMLVRVKSIAPSRLQRRHSSWNNVYKLKLIADDLQLPMVFSKNFGEVRELICDNTRLWLQPDKIIVGNFSDKSKIEEEFWIFRNLDGNIHETQSLKHFLPRKLKI
eukprot:TRINITY_DN10470_c0_g1_i1.p1 TRINITY_DN10470_c0_g1~~TRINITY_DN10470_c0_g1_i1.p1  ORF type:complete len:107 (+),score=3.20 TRINITY_DN10470_c0_g1_i1:43-363(+)